MKLVAAGSDRVRLRELGKTNQGNSFIALEIASPDTLKNLDRYKQLERQLYFQNGAPSARERDEIFRQGKVVVLITCSDRTRPRSARRRWHWSWCTSSRPTTRRRSRRFSTT